MTNGGHPVYRGQSLVDNAELWEAVKVDQPDFARIKDLVARAYSAETEKHDATDKEIGSWFFMAMRENPNFKGISVDKTPPRHIIFPNLAIKFDYIMRRPCILCMPYERVKYIKFYLHTEPVSRQVDRQGAFKKAVQAYLGRVSHDFTDFYNSRLCVAVLFAMRSTARTADVDNMTKTLLDAMQGYAYENDRQIDHLDLIRLNSGSDDAFIGIRIAVTSIAEDVDVIWPKFDVAWVKTAGVEPIDLTPYLEDKSAAER